MGIRSQVKRALSVLDRLEEWIIATCIAAATAIIFVAVVQRYGMSHLGRLVNAMKDAGHTGTAESLRNFYFTLAEIRLTWAQELCIILFIWMAKFGAAYGVRTGIHVGVDVLVNAVNERFRQALVLFGLASGALFTSIVGTLGARFVWHMFGTGQVSPTLEAPMWLVYLCIPLGSFLMCFRFLQVAWQFKKTGELPRHEIAHVAGIDEPDGESVR
jgi:C4-dicarboxylate transporter DctQ subunit